MILAGMWLAGLAAALLWRLPHFDAFGLNNDEGAYLMWARLVADGYALHSQTQSVSGPLFIEGLAAVFRLVGFGIVTGRLVILTAFALLAVAMARLSHRLAGWPGAFAALAMVAIPTPFFQLSRQVMAEIPATLLVVLAIGAAWQYSDTGNRRWLVASGVLLAVSLLTKTLYPAAALPVGWLILRTEKTWPGRWRAGLAFGLSLLAGLAVAVSFFDWPAFYDQTIRFRAELRAVSPWNWRNNWQAIVTFARPLWGIGLLAGAGLPFTLKTARGQAWTLWLAGNFVLLMWHNPLFLHHTIILLPPAILLAVEFVGVAFADFHSARGRALAALGAGLTLAALFSLPALVHLNRGWLAITTGGREAEAARVLNTVTRPTDFVISDSQLFVLLADRRTPPPLGDVALVAIKAGRQSADRLIDMSVAYDVQAVANWALRLPWLPDYLAWADENFWVHKVWDNDHQLYFGRKWPSDAPVPNAQATRLGDSVQLRGFSLDASAARPGQSLPLTLFWQTDAPLQTDYTVFVQMLNSGGGLAAQVDSQPLHGYFPTSQWPPDAIIPDRLELPLPADLPPGQYTVIAGMYNLDTLQRLPVAGTGGDFVALTAISVQ